MTEQEGRAVQKQGLPKRCASRCRILIMHLTSSLNDGYKGLQALHKGSRRV